MSNLKVEQTRHHVLNQKELLVQRIKQFNVKVLSAAITGIICFSVPPSYASDIEIYKVPDDAVGATTLMMMLDLSGSMGPGSSSYGSTSMSIQNDYAVIDSDGTVRQNVCVNGGLGSDNITVKTDSTTAAYPRYYCEIPANTTNTRVTDTKTGCEKQSNGTYRCYDRLTRLKDGLSQTLRGTSTVPRIDDKIIVGLSTFAGSNGYVRVPARPLIEVVGTYQIKVTKTRTVYDTLPVYETQQEQYEVTPAVAAYDQPFWRRRTTTQTNTTYRYSVCTWNAVTKTCTWSAYGNTSTAPTGFVTTKSSRKCTTNTDFNCTEYYDTIPAVPAVMGTRSVQVQVGTQQVPREETYEQEETRNITQRDLLLSTIKDLAAEGGTPTAYAYAEAAAYLMGKTTKTTTPTNLQTHFNMDDSSVRNSTTYFAKCDSQVWNGTVCNSWNYWYRNITIPALFAKNSAKSQFVAGSNTYSGYYYTGASSQTYTGFDSSISESKNSAQTAYNAPASITAQSTSTAKKECSGQGIYFLTDGEPGSGGVMTSSTGKGGTAFDMMSKALDTKASLFDCASSPLGGRADYASDNNNWTCIGKFAQALLDPAKNPAGVQIKTSVVGFGSSFGGGVANDDVEDAKSWGTLGAGGWIAGSKPEDVSNSINSFVGALNKDIPSMSTGSSTIPLDALNPAVVQPYSYFPQFEPKVRPENKQQVWFGNIKKYYVLNNSVYASSTLDNSKLVVKDSKLQDLADIWAKGGITYQEGTAAFLKGGALSQLPVGIQTASDGTKSTARKLLTDYAYDNTNTNPVGRNFDLVRVNTTYTTDEKTKTDTTYARALMGLLGYYIADDVNTNGLDLSTRTANLRQMGSTLHSKPILLTQVGKATAVTNASTNAVTVGSTNREDYILAGTSQGLVQVIDADTGVEKFAFVPKEIIEKQSETFKNGGGNLAGGRNALYYGMDGEWTAHTIYVTKSDGTLTVKDAVRNVVGSSTDTESLKGKQWVYGGMRMGGRSYYSLDLTNIDSPKIKFQIDPSTGKVYTKDHPEGTSYPAISKMGQSWSKPVLDYVNWKGQRKLVMFVGGGYDAGGDNGDGSYSNGIRTGYAGYETYNYQQENNKDSNNVERKIGAGVYMFDADTGDLLWNADSTTNADLKYSVVSQIKTVDRNNDGVVDHLYFGDLAGQAFRVDFKNDGSTTAFTAQATRILNLHQANGTSPRFYTSPLFTAHRSAGKTEGGNIVMAIFASGNSSSPLLASPDSPQKKDSSGLQFDGVYAVYDYDIYPQGSYYPSSNLAARTLAATSSTTASTTQLKYINDASTGAVIDSTSGWGGWYYLLKKKFNGNSTGESIVKVITNMIALEGNLYVTQYDSSDNGTTSSCGAGVLGNSFAQRLCLPTGVCSEDANYKYNLGSGVVELNVGPSSDNNDPNKRELVVPDPTKVCTGTSCSPCTGTACTGKPAFIPAGGALKFIPNRWYEKYVKAS